MIRSTSIKMTSNLSSEICQELLFALSGIKSSCIYENEITVKELLKKSELTLLERILVIGNKYCELKKVINVKYKNESSEYYILKCIDVLEQCLCPYRETLVKLNSERPSLSLIYSSIYPYSEIMDGLLTIAQELSAAGTRGCAILDILDQNYNRSTREMEIALKFIYQEVGTLMINHLQSWILYGEITDTTKEFFIQKNLNANLADPFDFYYLDYALLPSFIRPTIAEKILKVGLTVLFLRSRPKKNYCLAGEIPKEISIDSTGVTNERGKDLVLRFEEACKASVKQQWMLLERITQDVATLTTTQLHYLAMVDGGLAQQVHNIKQIFLMGRGELFHEFVTQTDNRTQMKGPTTYLDLNVLLRACARKVLLQEEILDSFSLELDGTQLLVKYFVPWPLQLLFTQEIIDTYNVVFRFLLKLKRIQVRMVAAWMCDKRKRRFVSCPRRRQLRQNLWFLVNNLQYYLQVDVLESQYMTLEAAVIASDNFEQVQMAHSRFLANLVLQSFLSNPKESNPNPVHQRLSNILLLCEEFCHYSERDEDEEMSMDVVDCLTVKFDGSFQKLLALLEALKKHGGYLGCHHLSQLLLRLDFNRFFSIQSSQFN